MVSDIPNCPRLHGADRGDRTQGIAGQPGLSGSLRRARHHRLPDHRLPVRRPRRGPPRPGDGGHRRAGPPSRPSRGYEHGKAFVFCETFMGTWGGTSEHDGQQGVPHMGANQSNVSIEMIESEYPTPDQRVRDARGYGRRGALPGRPRARPRVRDPFGGGDPQRALRQARPSRRTASSAGGRGQRPGTTSIRAAPTGSCRC